MSIPGLILLFVIAVLAYSMFRVHKQRQEIRVQAIDPIWEIPDAPWEPRMKPANLDEWDREYLAGRITEAEWQAGSSPRGPIDDGPSPSNDDPM